MTGAARQCGFLYLEVLVAAVLVVLALVPAVDALRGGLAAAQGHEAAARRHLHLASRVAELQAMPFAALDAEAQALANPGVPSAFSDAASAPRRRLVYLSRYDGDDADSDGDPFTGVDAGLLWLRVSIEGEVAALETLHARP